MRVSRGIHARAVVPISSPALLRSIPFSSTVAMTHSAREFKRSIIGMNSTPPTLIDRMLIRMLVIAFTFEKSAGNDLAFEARSAPSLLRMNFRLGGRPTTHPLLAS